MIQTSGQTPAGSCVCFGHPGPGSPRTGGLLPKTTRLSEPPSGRATRVPHQSEPIGLSFGPRLVHPIGTKRFATVSSSTSLAQVAGVILHKQARVQNPDKTAMAGGRHEG